MILIQMPKTKMLEADPKITTLKHAPRFGTRVYDFGSILCLAEGVGE